MSAILRALRKVENESVQRSETPPVAKKLDARKAIRDQYRKNRTIQKLLMLLLPLLTLAIVIWVVSSYKPFLIPESSTAAVKSNPSTSKPTGKVERPTSEERGKRSQAAPPGVSPSKEERAPSKGASKKEQKGAPDAILGQQEGPSSANPEFKLQAIVWSEVPESRFAVINGVIVRAGGMIEGISVTDIGKDYVSFESGQRTWKMKMMTE